MNFQLDQQTRSDAVSSLKEIGPAIYNQAVKEAQARIISRVDDLDGELYVEPFQYWSKGRVKRGR